jgi:hypothetical protein
LRTRFQTRFDQNSIPLLYHSYSILNSTIWRDGVPTSSNFSFCEECLIGQLHFAFLSDDEVEVASVRPAPRPLAKLHITKGSKFRTEATLKNSEFAISCQNGVFAISIGTAEPLGMKKTVHYTRNSVSVPSIEELADDLLSPLAE